MHACEDGSEKKSRFPRAWALGITAACAVGAIMLAAVRKPDAPQTTQTPAVTVEAKGAKQAATAPADAGDKPVLAIVTTSEPVFAKVAESTGENQPGGNTAGSTR